MLKFSLIRTVSFLFLSIFVLFAGCSENGASQGIAPDFNLNNLSGKKISLSQYSGKIVLLDFWATWCQPCRYSIPELISIQKRYKNQGVVVLGISVDDPKSFNDNYLKTFVRKFKINYEIMRVTDQVEMNYFSSGRINLPTMFVINREGIIVSKEVGFLPGRVEETLKELL